MLRTITSITLLLSIAGLATGCDDSSKPPASATGQGINNLAESPSSLLGKSAARGRDVARDAVNYQNEASGIAAEGTGEAQPVTVSGVGLSVPTSWTSRKPSSSMRVAEFVVAPDSGGGEAVVAFFGSIGGDAISNIERWRQQVVNPEGASVEETNTKVRTVSGIKVTTVSMDGTLKGGTMGGPAKDMPNSGFRAAIIEGPKGSAYIKFTGPISVISQNEGAWEAMISGMRKQ